MNKSFFSLLFILVFGWLLAQTGKPTRSQARAIYQQAEKNYHEAERLSSIVPYTDALEAKEEDLNRDALNGFQSCANGLDDSLAFHAWYRMGTLLHYFDSLPAAQHAYQQAIIIKQRVPLLADSFLFQPYLFNGGIYYSQNQFDSALSNYKRAEEIASRYEQPLNGTNRLFNTLGAMYYETGNYSQAVNYFEKALDILNPADPYYKGLMVNYKINLGAALTKQEQYEKARTLYEDLLSLQVNRNEIYHNLGAIHISENKPRNALEYLGRVHYENNKVIRLYHDIASAWMQLHQTDSAIAWLDKAIVANLAWNVSSKNSPYGLVLKLYGDVFKEQKNYTAAIEKYQLAIIQFCKNFDETEAGHNPNSFTGIFSYIPLFNTLIAKADALEALQQEKKDIKFSDAALKAYHAAFNLADYVERTYDSDEARLFLAKIKYTEHNKPIMTSMAMYEATGKSSYLEDAWLFDQRNKASVLSYHVNRNRLRTHTDATDQLSQKEKTTRATVTRLSLKASQVNDSTESNRINDELRDKEMELGKIQEQLNEVLSTDLFKQVPATKDIQQALDASTALLSYHLAERSVVILTITNEKTMAKVVAVDTSFYSQLNTFKQTLHYNSRNEEQKKLAAYLHQVLLSPVKKQLDDINRLIIIPDDELNYLPFESLQDDQGHYLLERFSVQYQYAASLILQKTVVKKQERMIAFAPYSKKGFTDSTGDQLSWLPGSLEELKTIDGTILLDAEAGKSSFLQTAQHYSTIHLATHASVNSEDPLSSFIAFYPADNNYKLYAREIYDLRLDSTDLIILSACETGDGQLIRGEGLMSLTRAFAYAGCPNIITSLWKAEDLSTAYIISRLHHYLNKGYTKDKALQQAKLDLLKDNRIDPKFKKMSAWAHLVFIGTYTSAPPVTHWWWIGFAILAAGVIAIIYQYVKRKSG